MDENKLVEKFAEGLTKAVTQISSLVVMFVLCAAATATDPFFRKNMGERYFTGFRCFIGALGWLAIDSIAIAYPISHQSKLSIFTMASGLSIFLAYVVLSFLNFKSIRRRKRTGELWHSRSRGESLFGSENPKRDLVVEVVGTIALCFVSIFHGLFFLLSRVMAHLAEAAAQAALYNRYLDIIDGKIESQFMETALREGYPPSKTGGFYRPLPRVFTGQHRANVARILASGPAPSVPTRAESQQPQTESKNPTSKGQSAEPAVPVFSQTVNVKSPVADTPAAVTPPVFVFRTIRYKKLGVVIAGIGIIAVGIWSAFHFRHGQTKQANSAVTSGNAQTASVEIEAKKPIALPAATSVVEPDNPAALAQAALETQRRQEEEKAREQAALEAQQRQEQERLAALETQKRQERENAFDQVRTALTDESVELSKFKAACVGQFDNNTNKIAELSRAYRKPFTQRNESTRAEVLASLQGDEDGLSKAQTTVNELAADPQTDIQQLNLRLRKQKAIINKRHLVIIAKLDALEADIANAPKKTGFLIFK